jgi:hypothetical protein
VNRFERPPDSPTLRRAAAVRLKAAAVLAVDRNALLCGGIAAGTSVEGG